MSDARAKAYQLVALATAVEEANANRRKRMKAMDNEEDDPLNIDAFMNEVAKEQESILDLVKSSLRDYGFFGTTAQKEQQEDNDEKEQAAGNAEEQVTANLDSKDTPIPVQSTLDSFYKMYHLGHKEGNNNSGLGKVHNSSTQTTLQSVSSESTDVFNLNKEQALAVSSSGSSDPINKLRDNAESSLEERHEVGMPRSLILPARPSPEGGVPIRGLQLSRPNEESLNTGNDSPYGLHPSHSFNDDISSSDDETVEPGLIKIRKPDQQHQRPPRPGHNPHACQNMVEDRSIKHYKSNEPKHDTMEQHCLAEQHFLLAEKERLEHEILEQERLKNEFLEQQRIEQEYLDALDDEYLEQEEDLTRELVEEQDRLKELVLEQHRQKQRIAEEELLKQENDLFQENAEEEEKEEAEAEEEDGLADQDYKQQQQQQQQQQQHNESRSVSNVKHCATLPELKDRQSSCVPTRRNKVTQTYDHRDEELKDANKRAADGAVKLKQCYKAFIEMQENYELKNRILSKKFEDLTSEAAQLKSQNEQLRKQKSRLENHNESLRKENLRLDDMNHQLHIEQSQIETQSKQDKKEKAQLETRNNILRTEIANIESKMQELAKQKTEMACKSQALERENENLERKNEELSNELALSRVKSEQLQQVNESLQVWKKNVATIIKPTEKKQKSDNSYSSDRDSLKDLGLSSFDALDSIGAISSDSGPAPCFSGDGITSFERGAVDVSGNKQVECLIPSQEDHSIIRAEKDRNYHRPSSPMSPRAMIRAASVSPPPPPPPPPPPRQHTSKRLPTFSRPGSPLPRTTSKGRSGLSLKSPPRGQLHHHDHHGIQQSNPQSLPDLPNFTTTTQKDQDQNDSVKIAQILHSPKGSRSLFCLSRQAPFDFSERLQERSKKSQKEGSPTLAPITNENHSTTFRASQRAVIRTSNKDQSDSGSITLSSNHQSVSPPELSSHKQSYLKSRFERGRVYMKQDIENRIAGITMTTEKPAPTTTGKARVKGLQCETSVTAYHDITSTTAGYEACISPLSRRLHSFNKKQIRTNHRQDEVSIESLALSPRMHVAEKQEKLRRKQGSAPCVPTSGQEGVPSNNRSRPPKLDMLSFLQ